MRVSEIFYSLEGEGTRAGRPTVFVRFTGCNLRCGYCDTAYAFHGGTERSRAEVRAAIGAHPARAVTLTGGEPMLQPELPALCRDLLADGYEVAVETNGTFPRDALPEAVVWVVDVKTPGSGFETRAFDHLRALRPHDEVKFVVTSRADFDWAAAVVRREELAGRAHVVFSPSHGEVAPADLAAWLLAAGLPARLSLQLHKILWGPTARGV